jgi:hypothetical protein
MQKLWLGLQLLGVGELLVLTRLKSKSIKCKLNNRDQFTLVSKHPTAGELFLASRQLQLQRRTSQDQERALTSKRGGRLSQLTTASSSLITNQQRLSPRQLPPGHQMWFSLLITSQQQQ